MDLPVCYGLTHAGITYAGGNKCYIPSVICDSRNEEKVRFSLEAHLCRTYPSYKFFFKDWRKLKVIPKNFKFKNVKELQPFRDLSFATAARIQISVDLLEVESDAMNRFRLFQFQLCHISHILALQHRKTNDTSTIPIPHLNQYFHTGIFPRIPFEYSKLFINKRNEFYAGQHITNTGMMGLIVDFFIDKVLRQTCKKRERCDIWILFFQRHPNVWPFFVDILLMYVFWGVYEPKDHHPRNYIPPIDVAIAMGMMARYMATFSIVEITQWIVDNQNLMILSWCSYIYDQIDNNSIYYTVLCSRFDHKEYNIKLKLALNEIRRHFSDNLQSIVVAHIQPKALQTDLILKKWKVFFAKADSISVEWYIETKNPKYSSPCNIFYELYVMFKTYYCEQWNIRRKASSSTEEYSEKKCFIHCDPEIHPHTTLLALWTILSGSKIPLLDLLFHIGLPISFLKIINILPFILLTHKTWKKTTLKNLHFRLIPYYDYIPYVIYYLDMCYKLSYLRYQQLSKSHEDIQINAVRRKSCNPFVTPPSCNLLLCRFCREVKNNYSASNSCSPFGGCLAFRQLPSLKPANQRQVFHHKNEFGPFKTNNIIINDVSEVSCGTKYFMNNVQEQNYMCQWEAQKVDICGRVIRTLHNMWFTVCEICGSTALVSKKNYVNGKWICDNELALEPRIQFAQSSLNLVRRPSYYCGVGKCNNATTNYRKITDSSGNFALFGVCKFHDTHINFNCFYNLEDINEQSKKSDEQNKYYSSSKYVSRQNAINALCKL